MKNNSRSEDDDVGGGVVELESVSGVLEGVVDGVGVGVGVTKAESTERGV